MAKITQEELGDAGLELVTRQNSLFTRWSETGCKFRLCNLIRSRKSKSASLLSSLESDITVTSLPIGNSSFPPYTTYFLEAPICSQVRLKCLLILGATPYFTSIARISEDDNRTTKSISAPTAVL